MATREFWKKQEQRADHAHAHGHRRGFGSVKDDFYSYGDAGDFTDLRPGYERRHMRKKAKQQWATQGKQNHQANVKAAQQEERELKARNRQNAKTAASTPKKADRVAADKPAKTPSSPSKPGKPNNRTPKGKKPGKEGISPLKAAGLVVGTSVLTSIGNRLVDKTAGAVENATTRALEKRSQKPAGNSWEQAARNVK
ncbi:MAG: hypothetical protein FWE95_07290 [Planctomycetaceae bacterium]|nr:hypothetical protein [Planctomycetaceae bacterium]